MSISICAAGVIFIKEVMHMTNYREILRLDSIGLNRTEIAESSDCSRNTVASALKRAAECGLSLTTSGGHVGSATVRDSVSESCGKPEYRMSDYEYVYLEMQSKGVTLNLLWLEYVEKCRREFRLVSTTCTEK